MKRKQIRFIGYCLTIGLIVALIMVIAACSSTSTSTPAPILSSIAVAPTSPSSLPVGYVQQFTATGTYSDSSTADITSQVIWASSDPNIATISSSGSVTAVAAGNTNITATLSGVTSPAVRLPVVVPISTPFTTPTTTSALTLSSIAVLPVSPVSLAVGSTELFTALGTYSDGSTTDITSKVTWTSSDPNIATISSQGLVTGVATGYATITAALSGVTSSAVSLTVGSP